MRPKIHSIWAAIPSNADEPSNETPSGGGVFECIVAFREQLTNVDFGVGKTIQDIASYIVNTGGINIHLDCRITNSGSYECKILFETTNASFAASQPGFIFSVDASKAICDSVVIREVVYFRASGRWAADNIFRPFLDRMEIERL